MTRRASREDGVFAILYALLVVVVILVAALVVDLGVMRSDRRATREAADAAALAGADVLTGDLRLANEACVQALQYATLNLGATVVASDIVDACSSWPASASTDCTTYTSTYSATLTSDPYSIELSWPVPDSSTLLTTPDVEGQTQTQPVGSTDGASCDRIAVSITKSKAGLFAGGSATTSTSVARTTYASDGEGGVPLVVLDKNSCQALTTSGSGANLVVQGWSDPANVLPDVPGRIAVDSDASSPSGATTACVGGDGSTNGSVVSAGSGEIYALDAPDKSSRGIIWSNALRGATPLRAFQTAGTCSSTVHSETVAGYAGYNLCVRPTPHKPITRRTFDETYGCPVSAPGCLLTSASPTDTNYVGRVVSFVAGGAPAAGWTVVPDGDSRCSNSSGFSAYLTGNWYIKCNTFLVSNLTAFGTGTVVFTGDVKVQNSGSCLLFNEVSSVASSSATTECASTAPPSEFSDAGRQSLVFLKGRFDVKSGASLYAPQTTIIQHGPDGSDFRTNFSTTGQINVSGPYGTDDPAHPRTCTAGAGLPEPACFPNLGMWNDYQADTTKPSTVAAGSSPGLDGAFFWPNCQVKIAGNPSPTVTRAQVYAGLLQVNGTGTLILSPDPNRELQEPIYGSELIR